MTFLSPPLLFGFAALAVPVIIHLWQRKRVVRVPFSTLRFLKIVAAKTSRMSRIENLLLFLLRLVLFALIIAAAARPVVSTDATQMFRGNVPRSVALVIDHSLSMSYRSGEDTRLDRAKQSALAVIEDLKSGDDVAVIAVSDRAQALVAEPTVDYLAARQAVEGVRPTEARTDFSEGLRAARQALAKSTRGVKQIFLFTDNQESGWKFDHAALFDDAWHRMDARLIVVRPDELDPVNNTVTKVGFATPFAAAGALTRGVATVENHSATTLRDVIEIKAGADKLGTKPVEVAPGSSAEVPFEFQAPALVERWLQGTISLSGDNLPADDRRYFILPVFQAPRVLVVESGAGPEREKPGFFLRKALAAGTQAAPIKTITPDELDDLPLGSFSAVFLAGVATVSDRSSVRLGQYLEAGGTVVFLPSDQTDLAALTRLEWMPATPERVRELPAGRQAAFAVEPLHPLFANSWDANTPFPALPQRKLIDWKPAETARVLLTLADVPFIIYGERGTGRVIIVNASPDRAWGDFPLTSAFLPLVQQIARLSLTRSGKTDAYVVGDTVPLPPSLPRDQALSLKTPGGDVMSIQPGAALLERAERAGFYEVSSGAEGALHQFAVNIDPREGDLTPIGSEALNGIVPHEPIAGVEALRVWLAQSRGLAPLWPALLLSALAVFGIESVYANFLARRRAQGETERIATGRLNKRRFGQPFRAAEAATPKENAAA